MWSRIIGGAALLVVIAAVVWALWPRPIAVETAVIGRGDLVVVVEAEGTSQVREVFQISAPVAGQLTRVSMHTGDPVEAGETVALLQPAGPGLLDERSRRIATAAVEAARAGVALAETELQQAEAKSAFAQSELARTTALAEDELVSTQALERQQLAASSAQQEVDAAKTALIVRQRNLDSAEAALIEGEGSDSEACCVEIKSPASGRVLTVINESEQVLQPGTPIMNIGDTSDLQVEVEVLSSEAVNIEVGAAASIDGWGGDPLRAQVTSIAPVAVTKVSAMGIEEQRVRVQLALLDGPESRDRLGHGFRVNARIVIWEGKDLILVPMGALFRQSSEWASFVVEDGQARVRPLSIGQWNAEFAEVTAGLEVGDTVIVHPGDVLTDGSAVTLLAD